MSNKHNSHRFKGKTATSHMEETLIETTQEEDQADIVEMQPAEIGRNKIADEKGGTSITWEEFPTAELLREHIFATNDIEEVILDIPEWKTKLRVKGLTAGRRSLIIKGALVNGQMDLEKLYADFVIYSTYHIGTGKQVFKPGDRDQINLKSGSVIERIAMTAARLSGVDQKTQGDIRKNSENPILNGNGTLSLPANLV